MQLSCVFNGTLTSFDHIIADSSNFISKAQTGVVAAYIFKLLPVSVRGECYHPRAFLGGRPALVLTKLPPSAMFCKDSSGFETSPSGQLPDPVLTTNCAAGIARNHVMWCFQEFILDCYFRQMWVDRRLRFNDTGVPVLSMNWLFLEKVTTATDSVWCVVFCCYFVPRISLIVNAWTRFTMCFELEPLT